jgi:hypothetical protein
VPGSHLPGVIQEPLWVAMEGRPFSKGLLAWVWVIPQVMSVQLRLKPAAAPASLHAAQGSRLDRPLPSKPHLLICQEWLPPGQVTEGWIGMAQAKGVGSWWRRVASGWTSL